MITFIFPIYKQEHVLEKGITLLDQYLSNHLDENQKTKLMSLSGVNQFPMRVKCATLSWHTLVSAMEGKKEEVNTEAAG